jgi:phytoene dehydrogenase-like protein
VVSIKVEHNRAIGVQCADGTVVPASTVVSCADGYTTIFKMLDGRFVDKKILFLYQRCDLFPALIQVSLGINQTFTDAPHTLSLPLLRPLIVDDQTRHTRIEVETFGSNSALCPEGKTIMTVRLPSRCEFWTHLRRNNRQRYRAEKRAIIREVIRILDTRFPGLAQHLERSDIATPATFVRYTRQLAGQLRRLAADPAHPGSANPQHVAGLGGVLHGRPLGGGGRGVAVRRAFRPVCGTDDLCPQRNGVCHQ